jgi:hypothetical protein
MRGSWVPGAPAAPPHAINDPVMMTTIWSMAAADMQFSTTPYIDDTIVGWMIPLQQHLAAAYLQDVVM